MLLRGFGGSQTGIALVHIGRLDGAPGHRLHLFSQRRYLRAVALSAEVTLSTSRCPSVSTATWILEPLRRLARPNPLERGLQGAPVDHYRRRLAFSPCPFAITASGYPQPAARTSPHQAVASAGTPRATAAGRAAYIATVPVLAM